MRMRRLRETFRLIPLINLHETGERRPEKTAFAPFLTSRAFRDQRQRSQP
jgi:hypothetical protein